MSRAKRRIYVLYPVLLLLLLLLVWFVAPAISNAQDENWQERPTQDFTILYTPGDEGTAEAYAGFVDSIYEEIATLFNHRTSTPLTLRLYPTFESYYAVNPLARDTRGIVAHADFRRRELAVILPQTEVQTPDEIQNNIRHELTHIVASDLSGNRLNTGFQEGIAQYVEIPTAERTRKIALLHQMQSENRLMSWADFDDRDKIYGAPEQSYPQTLSVVTFLIDTYGLTKFQDFLVNVSQSSGYRSAMEQAYGVSPTDLEATWRAWLPAFLDGSYVEQTASGYDLAHPRQLMESGRYAEAQTELEQAIAWLETTPQQELLNEAQALLSRSRDAQQAEQVALAAREALAAADYERARNLVTQAQAAYAAIGEKRQEQVLAVYASRTERGLRADQQLREAQGQARMLRFPEARANADAAAGSFAMLGDTFRMQEALALRDSLDGTQRLAGITLLTIGLLIAVVGLWGRWTMRETEIW